MKIQKLKNSRKNFTKRMSLVLMAVVFACSFATIKTVLADRFTDQINQLKQENTIKQSRLDVLKVEADGLQATISALQAQIDGLQAQINANQAKNEQLQKDIAAAEVELQKQRDLLGKNIKAMYLEGEISTIEMLASSKDLSDFVDKQQYRDAVKTKIKNTVDKVTALKQQLKAQKEEVERLLKEQKILQQNVATQKAEQDRLLNLNAGEQANVNQEMKDNFARITELRRQQAIENAKLFNGVQAGIPGGGGYPWGNAYCVHTGAVGGDCWNYDWYFNGSPWDSWGYGFRNCTSWVAYKLALDGKSGFTYLGNAADWPWGAQSRGIGVSYGSGARAGDAVVNPNGYYGHVMYAEAVLEDGRVVVSDYNRAGDGLYRGPEGGSAMAVSQAGLYFIHF
jgi:peptidoglycan DL-endopeptidase CwlO